MTRYSLATSPDGTPTPRRGSLAIRLLCLLGLSAATAAPDRLVGEAYRRFPSGTKVVASFATAKDQGADRLVDGDPQTMMIGAEGSCQAADTPVWVDFVFGRPIENLVGVVTGRSDPFMNYYPKRAEFWLDTTGNGQYDTLAGRAELGGGAKAAGQHRFAQPVAKAFALRFLVTEQNKAGVSRCFALSELSLLATRPPEPPAPLPVARPVRVAEAGDRHLRMNIVYPPGAFREAGGPVLNVKQAPFGAVGDGRTDDTAAFIRVLDFVADEQAAKRRSWIVYVPTGEYLVSDSLVSRHDAGPEGFCYLRLVGQDRENTILRLKDGAPGFGDPRQPKCVLPWEGAKAGQGNILWGNVARNFTIDTGRGNPGAVAMTFMGANASSMDNLTLRSGDGQGVVGLQFSWWSVQGHYCDITVSGFDVGIRGSDPRETQPTLEYVTLSCQRQAGYEVGPQAASVRRLRYQGPAPAVVVNHPAAQLVLLDSRLEGQGAASSAIVLRGQRGAQVFCRNVAVSGYAKALEAFGEPVLAGDIDEYVSGPVLRCFNQAPARSMELPVEEVRLVPWESNPANWTSPEDYQGTVPERVQAALNSGKPAIFFPKVYDITDRSVVLRVPATVRQMDFLNLPSKWWCTFAVDQPSKTPLWVENAAAMPAFSLQQPRDIHLRYGRYGVLVETDQPVSIHMQNGAALSAAWQPKACPPNARIYARSVNEESWEKTLHPNFRVNGGLMWVLGFKTEMRQPSFLVENGGLLEVLGGYVNMTTSDGTSYPMVINNDANASVVATSFMGRKHPEAIYEAQGDWQVRVANDELPRRAASTVNYTMPLYVGYRPTDRARLGEPAR